MCLSTALALGEVTAYRMLNDAAGYICKTTRVQPGNGTSSQPEKDGGCDHNMGQTKESASPPLICIAEYLAILELFATGNRQDTVHVVKRLIDALLRVIDYQRVSR